ncbi:hypothetical protein F4808DRAFT_442301 [Astrocystis sublimbata]|nr:hypothetical protein F4808DRAFT_442301 [Astrocystis sublimbata]
MTIPIFLSPALPSELLSYILDQHVFPTILIICSSKAEFLESVVEDIRTQPAKTTPNIVDLEEEHKSGEEHEEQHDEEPPHPSKPVNRGETDMKHALLSSPLSQIATSRHIRVVYTPTVTHLRAYLAVFSPKDSRVPAPPTSTHGMRHGKPRIILYGFLGLHRDTSEWSAQGISNTTATLVDLAHRLSWPALVIEPRSSITFEEILQEAVPILSGGARKLVPDFDEGAWSGRTVELGRILGRWVRFQRAQWDISDSHD